MVSKSKAKRSVIDKGSGACESCALVIGKMNTLSGKRFRPVGVNLKNLHARHAEYSVEDCLIVVENKARQWLGGEMEYYFRPSTLFRPSHFDEYLNEPTERHSTTYGNRKPLQPKVEARPKAQYMFRCSLCDARWTGIGVLVDMDGTIKIARSNVDAMMRHEAWMGDSNDVCGCDSPVEVTKR